MNIDKRTLNLAAAVLSTVAAAISLLSALFGRARGTGVLIPSALGAVGSAAWLMSAMQEMQDQPEYA